MSDELPEREVVVTFTATGTVRLLANSDASNDEAGVVLRDVLLEDIRDSLGVYEDFVLYHRLDVEVEVKDA
jgi:hypothetical protein